MLASRIAVVKAGMVVEAAFNGESNYVKSSRFARGRGELAQRLPSAVRVQTTGDARENPELFLTQAKFEAQMFPANPEYREALAGLKALMRER